MCKIFIQPVSKLLLKIPCLLLILGISSTLYSQPELGLKSPVRDIRLEKIKIEGARTINHQRIKGVIKLQEGTSYLPNILKLKVREAIKDLFELGWFEDIAVEIEYPQTVEGVNLVFQIKELPTLGVTILKGNSELEEKEIREAMNLLEGQMFSQAALERERQGILKLYEEEGFQLTEVDISREEDEKTGLIDVTFIINEGKQVKVRNIVFKGNSRLKGRKLRGQMETKKKSWFFGIGGEFKEEEFRGSLDSIVHYYQQKGFLDAKVLSHKIDYSRDKTFLDISIDVFEGHQYRFGKASFVHNDIMTERALQEQIMLDSGEIANIEKFQASRFKVEMLYRDIGHLFVQVQEERKYEDSVLNVVYTVNEGGIAHINKVHIRGNTKTKDKVIRREMKIFPGDIFNQSLVMRSQREVMQLNYFDGVMPNFEPLGNDDVDLVFEVMEKEAGTGTFSAGAAYSGREELVFTLGLQIPNFLGNGQRTNLNIEYGELKQLYSIGFTEPWFLDTPTLVGGSLSWRRYYNYYYNDYIAENIESGYEYFIEYGFTGRLGRRLTWPDDYFTISTHYSLNQNDNGRPRDPDELLQWSGLASAVGVTLVRDDKDLPMFPSDGSRYTFEYKKYGGLLGGDFDFSTYETKIQWWFPTIHKLVLGIESELGIIYGDQIQQWNLYRMGGILGFEGKMRGYDDGSIGRYRIGRSYFSFVSQLTYPIAPNVFYLQAFFDMGNVFGEELISSSPKTGALGNPVNDIDFTDLLSDYGVGFRLVIPMVGIMGFDFGWPIGPWNRNGGERVAHDTWRTNFVIEAPY
ncbi:MAG: outer membrane protein assembly factor BamA [Fibrobacteria bacterium]|nr:outer membrane protein assembly factor BamA [Fibrobacteria bacterium]